MAHEREAVMPLGPQALTGNAAFAMSVALLFLRLALGWTFIFHGLQLTIGAFGGLGVNGFAEHMPAMPAFLPKIVWAYLAAYGQLIGGISVMLGLLARLGTVPIIVSMVVAIVTVHAPSGFDIQHRPTVGYEYNMNLIAMALAILLAGPGLISVDALLFRRGLWARGPQPLR
ncbi:MAG: DoxX family protein [Phycisphaerales bacterium]|nr:DoxX family protein [Phycisphaerales bacterium]